MPNIYCPSCGCGTKFTFDKPVKCPSCSSPYIKEPIKKETFYIESSPASKGFYDNIQVSLSDIKVSIEKPFVPKLGAIIGTDQSGETFSRPKIDKNKYFQSVFESKNNSFE